MTIGAGTTARKLTGARFEWEITKDLAGVPTLARIGVYNMPEEFVALAQERYAKVLFRAGYGGQLEDVVVADIRNVIPETRDTDRVFNIYAGSGQRAFDSAIFNRNVSESLNLNTLLSDLVADFGDIDVGEILTENISDSLTAQSISGSVASVLNDLAERFDFNWSVENDKFNAIPFDKILSRPRAVLLSHATGLLGDPTVTEIGVRAESRFIPAIIPGGLIQIESVRSDVQYGDLFFTTPPRTSAEGAYKVLRVTHTGDTHGEGRSQTLGVFYAG